MKYPMIFDDFFYTIYLFARSWPPQLTLELFSSRSVHVGGGDRDDDDVPVVVVLRLNFVVLSLSRTVSMRLCFRFLSARLWHAIWDLVFSNCCYVSFSFVCVQFLFPFQQKKNNTKFSSLCEAMHHHLNATQRCCVLKRVCLNTHIRLGVRVCFNAHSCIQHWFIIINLDDAMLCNAVPFHEEISNVQVFFLSLSFSRFMRHEFHL